MKSQRKPRSGLETGTCGLTEIISITYEYIKHFMHRMHADFLGFISKQEHKWSPTKSFQSYMSVATLPMFFYAIHATVFFHSWLSKIAYVIHLEHVVHVTGNAYSKSWGNLKVTSHNWGDSTMASHSRDGMHPTADLNLMGL